MKQLENRRMKQKGGIIRNKMRTQRRKRGNMMQRESSTIFSKKMRTQQQKRRNIIQKECDVYSNKMKI